GRVGGPAAEGVPLVVEPHDLGAEVDVEGLPGVAAHVEPAQDRRLEHAQGILGGGGPTAEDALRVLEAPILRWLYVRRNPRQTFDVDFGPEVVRLYDEWDSLGRRAADPS